MNIVMVCPDWFPFSAGLSQSCYDLCKQLQAHGHQVKIIVAKDPGVDHKGMTVIEIPYLVRLLGRNPIPLGYWNNIKKHIAWSDVVCLFSYMYEMNSRVVLFRQLGLFKKPLVHFYRGSLESDSLKNISAITRFAKHAWDASLGRLMFTQTDITISNSGPTLKLIKQRYNVPKKKLSYIKNALHEDDYPQWKKEHKRIVFIGRLIENKGIHYFERILRSIPKDWKFTIIGTGPMESTIYELAKKHTQIEYLGKLSHQDTIQTLSESDILILPTLAEGSPRVVMEANACGVPAVSFAVGDVINVLPKESAIKPFLIESFCNRLETLIAKPELRRKLGKEARQFAKQELSWKVIYPQIEHELKKAISLDL